MCTKNVVINNQAHETVGGMPVCDGRLDLPALARAAGYEEAISAENEESLQTALAHAKEIIGPVMVEVRCACGARADLGRPTTTPTENRDALMAFLQNA